MFVIPEFLVANLGLLAIALLWGIGSFITGVIVALVTWSTARWATYRYTTWREMAKLDAAREFVRKHGTPTVMPVPEAGGAK